MIVSASLQNHKARQTRKATGEFMVAVAASGSPHLVILYRILQKEYDMNRIKLRDSLCKDVNVLINATFTSVSVYRLAVLVVR